MWPMGRRSTRQNGVELAGVELAGAVLCGGASRRVGAGVDKAALMLDGERLVDRAARTLATVADPIVIASGRRGRFDGLAWDEVDDARAHSGPLGGLVAALRWAPAPLLAVVAVDMVAVDADFLAWLASSSSGN